MARDQPEEAMILLSLSGVGPVTAAALPANAGAGSRFENPSQVSNLAGLVPRCVAVRNLVFCCVTEIGGPPEDPGGRRRVHCLAGQPADPPGRVIVLPPLAASAAGSCGPRQTPRSDAFDAPPGAHRRRLAAG